MLKYLTVIVSIVITHYATGQSFQQKTLDAGNIGITLSNVGTIGQPNIRNNPSGPPSMEYPLNSGIEHLFEGGLWLGAVVNGQKRVSTVTLDAPAGYFAGGSGFEFTALSDITEKSRLPSSNYYSSSAVAHQEYHFSMTDSNTIVPGTSIKIQDHLYPLKAVADVRCMAWNYSFTDFFAIFEYKITNYSSEKWDSVYCGFWTDLVVRNVNVTQDAGTAFYNKGGGGYIDSFNALYAFQVNGDDIDFTQSYGASQFLGILWRGLYLHPKNLKLEKDSGIKINVNANFWDFRTFSGGKYGAPADDVQRYEKLSKGLVFPDPALQLPGNKTQLLSAGPVPEIKPGETFIVVFALVAARQLVYKTDNEASRQELYQHLNWAKRTFTGEDLNENGMLDKDEDLNNNQQIDRYILPEPPHTPVMKIISSNNKVDIYWDKSAIESIDPITKKHDFEGFRLYRTVLGSDFNLKMVQEAKLIAQWDSAGNNNGFNNGFEEIRLKNPITFEDDTVSYYFHYSIDGLLNGWQYLFILTAFDKGDPALGLASLESSKTENAVSVFPGTPAENDNNTGIGIYPNPYYSNAAWDGVTSRTRKIIFYNLPEKCEILICTVSGELIRTLQHDAETYQGEDIQWFNNFSGSKKRVFSGGEHAWDLLSENGQLVTQGIYFVIVKDLLSGEIKKGTFTIVK
ncbi:MAG: hypothetical protein GX437_05735 [Sphingobacteriales bacterium]|nr:hypothetical protein [Sphingobacteriales bacterium]